MRISDWSSDVCSSDLFHTVYDNYQNAGFISLQFLVNNADKVTVNGLEADGSFAIAPGVTFNVGATYLDAKYNSYLGGACYPGRSPDSLPVGGVFTACDLSGDNLPYTPHWKCNARSEESSLRKEVVGMCSYRLL